jgi:hypothetical protein
MHECRTVGKCEDRDKTLVVYRPIGFAEKPPHENVVLYRRSNPAALGFPIAAVVEAAFTHDFF